MAKTDWQTGDTVAATDMNDLGAEINNRPALWTWDGIDPWAAPAHAQPGDLVWNIDTGDVYPIEEV